MLCRWTFTVPSDNSNRRAIPLLLSPVEARLAISCSREVNKVIVTVFVLHLASDAMDMTGFIHKKCDGHHKKAPCPCFMRTDFCLFVPGHGWARNDRFGHLRRRPRQRRWQ